MTNNIINHKKYKEVLKQLVSLNNNGIQMITDKVSSCTLLGCSKVEYFEAFKKDADKTAEYIVNSQGIINSIKNGYITELELFAKDFFGDSWNEDKACVTLCGVELYPLNGFTFTKAEIRKEILQALYDIDSKKLTSTLTALKKLEEQDSEVKKAILSPTHKFANDLIDKLKVMDVKFQEYTKTLSVEDNNILNATFKRGGIDVVIESSSYITSNEIKQTSPKHSSFELLEVSKFLKDSKYFDDCEIDQDGDVKKALKFMQQVERLNMNFDTKMTFKFRKLGNYKANGMYIKALNMICEDIRETSAMLHEIGHLIHLTHFNDSAWLNNLIARLDARIDLSNVPEHMQDWAMKKSAYFHEDTEIVARACELSAMIRHEQGKLITGSDEFTLFKDRATYEEREGIYFNFKSFDKELLADMDTLFDLFYNTSPDEVGKISDLDNFVKQSTEYKVKSKETDIRDIIRQEANKAERDQRKLYSLVTNENIDYIYENANCSIHELSNTIFANIRYIGGHNARMMANEWALALEDKALVIDYIFTKLQGTMTQKEYVIYLQKIKNTGVWSKIERLLNLSGFNTKFVLALRKEFKEMETPGMESYKELLSVMRAGPISLCSFDMLQDYEFVELLIGMDPYCITSIDETRVLDIDQLFTYQMIAYKEQKKNFGFGTHKALADNYEIGEFLVNNDIADITYVGKDLKNNSKFMDFAISKGVQMFNLGTRLQDSFEFMSKYIKKDPTIASYLSPRLQEDERILSLYDNVEKEMDELKGANTAVRKRIAKKTKEVKTLEFLAKDKNMEVRSEVAKRDICPVYILEKLSKLKDVWIKKAVAENSNTPSDILHTIIRESDDHMVLQGAAKNPNLTFQKLLQLAQMSNRCIGEEVLLNESVQDFSFGIKKTREIVKECFKDNAEHFYYVINQTARGDLSFKLLNDIYHNAEDYFYEGGWGTPFKEMTEKQMKHRFPDNNITPLVLEDIKITPKVVEVEESDKEAIDFEELIQEGKIEDFEDTRNGNILKVLKIEKRLSRDNWKAFVKYLKDNSIGYYSKFTGGYVMTNIEKAASVATVTYCTEVLEVFAKGTLL